MKPGRKGNLIKTQKTSKQKGSALIVGLVILLLLTLLGVTAFKDAAMQERMAGNLGDANAAFQSAEAAIREAVRTDDLASKNYNGSTKGYGQQISSFTNSDGANVSEGEFWAGQFDWTGKSVTAQQPEKTESAPQYFVENIPANTGIWKAGERAKRAYRITARANGYSDRSEAILQSTILLED
ncbi:pilus assembly protein [Uliginosibacterium paludis]|uniref:Pilus assembly protein n=1 Tax=Uliginosibacterium paludis TaxID=1615952 RepID=A0ABV2CK50_9RHOO